MRAIKLIIIAFFVLTTVGALLYARHERKLRIKYQNKSETASEQIQAEAEIISRKVDKDGLKHAVIEAAKNIIPQSMVNSGVSDSEGILDTTAMAIGVLKKQVQNLTIVKSTLEVELAQMKKQVDTNNKPYFVFSDKYIDARFTPPTDSLDSIGYLDFKYNAELNLVQHWDRKWFLGSKKSYIDIWSNDKRTTINGVKRLVVEQDNPQFGLRIQGNANYNFQTGDLGFGPAVRIDAGRFSFQGSYNWFPDHQQWAPVINGNYDLIRF